MYILLRQSESNRRNSAYETELVPSPVHAAILEPPTRFELITSSLQVKHSTIKVKEANEKVAPELNWIFALQPSLRPYLNRDHV